MTDITPAAPENGAPNGAENTQNAQRAERHWLDNLAVAAASLAAIGAFVAAGAGFWQASIARDSEQRQLRAYVHIIPGIADFAVGKAPTISMTIKNGGQTPAYDFNASLNGDIMDFPQKETVEGKGVQPSPITPTKDGIGAFVYQTHDISLSTTMKNVVSQSDFDAVMDGTKRRFFIWGRVLYLDAFNASHYVNFCSTIDGASLSKGTDHPCASYNDTDH